MWLYGQQRELWRLLWCRKYLSFLFPRYKKRHSTNGNSASNSLNKWLHQHVSENYVIHSFRYSLRDRLRKEGSPADVMDGLAAGQSTQLGRDMVKGISDLYLVNGY